MPRALSPQTLQRPVTVTGHGLHSNRPCSVTLRPSSTALGLRFVHTPTGTVIPASADFVGDLSLATTLVKGEVRLGTIEHLLSALAGLEVEHLQIEVDGPELPILDGSSLPWVTAILEAGLQALPGKRRFIKVLRTVEVKAPGKSIRISPHSDFRVRYAIEFNHPAIGKQARELTMTPEKYQQELASARTFCMETDIEAMRSMGLALGGSLDNAVVFGAQGPLNEALRYEDEAVRHKMLDLVGDLALLGAPLQGLVDAHAAGHALHVALVKALKADRDAWTWAEAGARSSRSVFFPQRLSAQPA